MEQYSEQIGKMFEIMIFKKGGLAKIVFFIFFFELEMTDVKKISNNIQNNLEKISK